MIQRLTILGLILCAALATTGCSQARIPEPADEKPEALKRINFEGKWDGRYEPSEGTPGEGKYEFNKEKDGRWEIKVSWMEGKDTFTMALEGERLGPDSLRLNGKYGDTSYWYIGRMKDNTMVLQYLSVEGKTGKSGSGVSRLTRPK